MFKEFFDDLKRRHVVRIANNWCQIIEIIGVRVKILLIRERSTTGAKLSIGFYSDSIQKRSRYTG